jgi:hypothetical protein
MIDDVIVCPVSGCGSPVERIERYKTTIVWEHTPTGWDCGACDEGTHFHLFCSQGHEVKRWGGALPPEVRKVVYPGDHRDVPTPQPTTRPAIPWGAPHGKREWDAMMAKHWPAEMAKRDPSSGASSKRLGTE